MNLANRLRTLERETAARSVLRTVGPPRLPNESDVRLVLEVATMHRETVVRLRPALGPRIDRLQTAIDTGSLDGLYPGDLDTSPEKFRALWANSIADEPAGSEA